MAWIVKLVNIGAEGEAQATDVMEISRPDDLRDVADLGLTLSETKRLLAGLQHEMVAAQVRTLTTYQFQPEAVDGWAFDMVKARPWTDRVIGWAGSSIWRRVSVLCWRSDCPGNAKRSGRTWRSWLQQC